MKISVVGTGYVGLVSGTCFAEVGHDVTCIDIDAKKIETLNLGKSPIYEPGLTDLLTRNIQGGRLHFSNDYDSVKTADVVFLAVGTPSNETGEANLDYLKEAACTTAKNLKNNCVVALKSTVPVGTAFMIKKLMTEYTNRDFDIVNNPEFLKEGSAIENFMAPDRVIIGHDNIDAARLVGECYAPFIKRGSSILLMSNLSAEMSKYAANCFLATKISFINEIANLCDLTGADINEVRRGISTDRRIGGHFLYAGPGYGGSCFPKDIKALLATSDNVGMELEIVKAVEKINESQKVVMFHKIKNHFKGELKGKTFTFWGVAFKANTDDVRESSAIIMAQKLIESGATIHFYDPIASDNYLKVMEEYPELRQKIIPFKNKYDALKESSGLVTLTEWREFTAPDFYEIKTRIKEANIFDARNLFTTEKVLEAGFQYYAIGKRIDV